MEYGTEWQTDGWTDGQADWNQYTPPYQFRNCNYKSKALSQPSYLHTWKYSLYLGTGTRCHFSRWLIGSHYINTIRVNPPWRFGLGCGVIQGIWDSCDPWITPLVPLLTICPKYYTHCPYFVGFCYSLVQVLVWYNFTHILQGNFIGTVAITWLPQWNILEEYG